MPNSSPDQEELRALVALTTLSGVGDIGIANRLATNKSARHALDAETIDRRSAAYLEADNIIKSAQRCGAQVIGRSDSEYPPRLLELHDPPAVVYARGQLLAATPPAVAIVGTRQASTYGLRVARAIATACARAGATVVSGLARGIDGAAHEAALLAGGRTVAVLGTGVDVHYPRSHRALQETIARDGLLLSELPPGANGHSGTFPRRNRIIAALADVTVVVEAGRDSGALITADCALELGRAVASVPNAIDLPGAFGSNALLKRGAEPVLEPDDVLALLELRATPTPLPPLDANAASCWSAIAAGASSFDAIARATSLSLRTVAATVSLLELEGLLSVDVTGTVRSSIGRQTR